MSKKLKRLIALLCFLCIAAYIVSGRIAYSSTGGQKPKIEMDSNTVEVSVTDPETAIFNGITATDKEDGDVTEDLLVESLGNMDNNNARKAVICAFDSDGNVSKVTRQVKYTDYSSPVFDLTAPLKIVGSQQDTALDGVTATDVLDGDLTDQIQLVVRKTIDTTATADYKANLIVTNSAGDTTRLPVTLTACTVTDLTSAPSIELSKYILYLDKDADMPNPMSFLEQVTLGDKVWVWNGSDFDLQPDDDGTVPTLSEGETKIKASNIKLENPVDTSQAGTYEVDYWVKGYKKNPASHVRLIVVVR